MSVCVTPLSGTADELNNFLKRSLSRRVVICFVMRYLYYVSELGGI